MSIRNLAWCASNESRFFPIDDSATFLDDSGLRPPLQAICDAKILVPDNLGKFIYIGALSVTPYIVSVILMSSDALDSPGTIIASISQRIPLTKHYPYQLSKQSDGVGGWISFGSLADLSYQGKFSLPSQSLISPLAVRWLKSPPISTVRSQGGSGLTGLVKLIGGNDIEIVKECREIPDNSLLPYHESYCGENKREVIVIRLKNKASDSTRNIYSIYSGQCAKRPSSRTCGDPQPIESIGPISPDCNGNITVRLGGCIDALAVRSLVDTSDSNDPVFSETASGVVLSCSMTLDETCTENRLPDADGRLPSDFDEFEEESVSSVSESHSEPPTIPDFEFDAGSGSSFSTTFSSLSSGTSWAVHSGGIEYVDGNLRAGSFARNVATYQPISLDNALYGKVSARVMLDSGQHGTLHNAYVVANYREAYGFYAAEIDWDMQTTGAKELRISKFDGFKWETLGAAPVNLLQLGKQYDISLSVQHHGANDAWLWARVQGVADPSFIASVDPVFVSDYGAAPGTFGIGTNRSVTFFDSFNIGGISDPG
jgi:hypothetical protein